MAKERKLTTGEGVARSKYVGRQCGEILKTVKTKGQDQAGIMTQGVTSNSLLLSSRPRFHFRLFVIWSEV